VNRRPWGLWAVLAGVCALLALSSCSTFNHNEVAAQINGDSLSNAELSQMVRSDLYATVLQSGVVGGLTNGDAARALLDGWLKLQLLEQSGAFKDVDRKAVANGLEQTNGDAWTAAPVVLQDLLVRNAAATQLSTAGTLDTATALKNLATAEVFIDPRYGRWDSASSSVVALNS
jgi:hypothetical protein